MCVYICIYVRVYIYVYIVTPSRNIRQLRSNDHFWHLEFSFKMLLFTQSHTKTEFLGETTDFRY